MSSRKSGPSGEGLPHSKCRERTPLKSLENEKLHLSTSSSRVKSLLNADIVKTLKGDSPFCNPEPNLLSSPSTKRIHSNDYPTDQSDHTAYGDLTLKSFLCSGGEVEIEGSPVRAEESILLPKNQAGKNPCETEDSVLFNSTYVHSCSDHIEHPYHKPEMRDASLAKIGMAHLFDISNTSELGDFDEGHATQDLQQNMTWKSYVCEGGEVEVFDATRLNQTEDKSISLPQEQIGEPSVETSVNQTEISDYGQLFEAEHADHPYCSGEKTASDSEKNAHGVSDVTFKSFDCTGGEVEISEGTKLAEKTVPLSADLTCSESYSSADPSILPGDEDVQEGDDHFDHPYCNSKNSLLTQGSAPFITQEAVSLDVVDDFKQISLVEDSIQPGRQDNSTPGLFTSFKIEAEQSNGIQMSHMTPSLSEDQVVICPPSDVNCVPTSVTQDKIQDNKEQPNSLVANDEDVVDIDPPAEGSSSLTDKSLKVLKNKSVNCQTSENDSLHPMDSALLLMHHKTDYPVSSPPAALTEVPTSVGAHEEHASALPLSSESHGPSEAKDSAFGSSGNAPVLYDSDDKPPAENPPDVFKVLSECPSVASALPFRMLSPIVRRASLLLLKAHKGSEVDKFFADDSALDGEKSLVAPVSLDPASLWAEPLESPMPRPLFNSTALGFKVQPDQLTDAVEDVEVKPRTVPQPKVEKLNLDTPLIQDGPLQQQLRQMAEFLFLASGKMGPAAVSAPICPPAVPTAQSAKETPVESHSICVGTTPMKQINHSVNTSGKFERKREFSVVDSCTLTDPLLWNVPPGSLECLPKQELEQRLRSSMIMVEALVQQLASARTHPTAGPAPSDLREKLVQTDHTELSQTTMHRELYFEALSRIGELEMDESSLQNLIQNMQDTKATMTSLSYNTDAALTSLKQMGDVVREDHQSLTSHYDQMTSVLKKTKEVQTAMVQKVKEAFHQRDDMKTQMEEAFSAKEAAFSAIEELRTHCASEISELEKTVGSHQELLAALNQTFPQQVALNKAYTEILESAADVLSTTKEEQSSLMEELCTVRGFLQQAAPLLLKLNEKAVAALRERDEYISERDQAVEEREQITEEWNQANLNLQTAREEIGDLNLQVTILTSEMGVLRQKLAERDEERGQLERKVTELSATISSTLASYTFLEQALAAESTKLQQSWKDIQLSKDRAKELEVSLAESEKHVCELSQDLAQSKEQLSQLQALSQSQNMQIQQLQDVCTQLTGVREENEFLQMENELAREQMTESERGLRANLQALRERNIQCEDLKGELSQLQLEKINLQKDLENTRSQAKASQLELGERLAQATTEIILLHHTLRGVTTELHAALNEQKPKLMKDNQLVPNLERRHPSSSFVDSIMVALTAEKEEGGDETAPGSDTSEVPEPQCETLSSETSAFTRIAPVTPKKSISAVEFEPQADGQSSEAELFAALSCTVTELVNNLKLLRERKDAQLEELHNTLRVLQGEQQAADSRHVAEVFELKHQLNHLNNLVEKGSQALQQKAQDEKTVVKLMSDLQEAQEILNKHKTESNELRKEVVELRRSLQQSKVESQFLREKLMKAGGPSPDPAHFMEDKIQLLKEVERLKLSLQEVEQARAKLLERAKRHQVIHQTNQQKSEKELQMLNNMINRVRETLLSLPEVVKKSEQLQQLVEYIG
ncbi:sperm-associated antigen 5 [Halichoeres trimaculatus]|uniref:sperm-associated antigen 5 n=1 Tax=Halichoeres trimaculatus TaxID=147232 RepID=UPI003D9E50FA